MKLELKHLAPYLPYELKCQWNNINYDLISLRSNDRGQLIDFFTDEVYGVKFEFIKPILRPLSDLTKEIEFNGEKFTPTVWLRDNCGNFDISKKDMETLISMFLHVFTNPISAPYYFIEKLLEWHFDVFGLIDAGLAIDINTLNK